jgi:carbonic anhydrase
VSERVSERVSGRASGRVTASDHLVEAARRAEASWPGPLPVKPSTGVAVVACMDARIDVHSLFGLSPGDAHVIRNAGGLVTDDTVRSLAISQRLLGTTEVVLVHHTNCGMLGLDDDAFAADVEKDAGRRPSWRAGGFTDAAEDVRQSMQALRECPFLPARDAIRGFVLDVDTGALEEVPA